MQKILVVGRPRTGKTSFARGLMMTIKQTLQEAGNEEPRVGIFDPDIYPDQGDIEAWLKMVEDQGFDAAIATAQLSIREPPTLAYGGERYESHKWPLIDQFDAVYRVEYVRLKDKATMDDRLKEGRY